MATAAIGTPPNETSTPDGPKQSRLAAANERHRLPEYADRVSCWLRTAVEPPHCCAYPNCAPSRVAPKAAPWAADA